MKLRFVISNDKALYISKEDRFCLFIVVKEAALNKQQIKPCVPLDIKIKISFKSQNPSIFLMIFLKCFILNTLRLRSDPYRIFGL